VREQFSKWKILCGIVQTQPDTFHNDQHNLPWAAQISIWFKTCLFLGVK